MGPTVTHLLFADDSLFLCKARVEQAMVLNNILQAYGNATGQVINHSKSSISFGRNVNPVTQAQVRQILGIAASGGNGKYLGLPDSLTGSKVNLFSFIKDRVKQRISSWFAKTLSQGGKEVLMKSVISALPVYAMSVFKMPKTVCANLASAMAQFWWHNVEHKGKIHWLSWDKLCLPKAMGGMGFRDFECFNQALLAKQGWRILSEPDRLMAQVLRSRYFPEGNFLNANLGSRPSYAWRSILWGRELLNKGLKVSVGNGNSVKVWSDPCLEDEDGFLRAPYRKEIYFNVNLLASDLIDSQTGRWNRAALESIFVRNDIHNLLRNQPSVSRNDSFVWRFTCHGRYTVSSGYQLAFEANQSQAWQFAKIQPSINGLIEKVWRVKAPSKIKVFLWKALSGALAVDDLLAERGVKQDGFCQVCGEAGESINHMLFTCSLSRQVWALTDIPHPRAGFDSFSLFSNFSFLLSMERNRSIPVELKQIFPWVMWFIWKNRNALMFEGKRYSAKDTVGKIREEASLWFMAQHMGQDVQRRLYSTSCLDQRERQQSYWSPPRQGWLKCNIGVVWSRGKRLGGMAWVLRNSSGDVVLHSRRSMSNISSCEEAQLLGLLWAMESMVAHHVLKVAFAIDSCRIKDAILRPIAWPSFSYLVGEIRLVTRHFLVWSLEVDSKAANRGAHLIAKSATKERWMQSYVAVSHPLWLDGLFRSEMTPSVVA